MEWHCLLRIYEAGREYSYSTTSIVTHASTAPFPPHSIKKELGKRKERARNIGDFMKKVHSATCVH